MTDIVERLEATGGKGQGGPLKKEAADEIRKLRAIIASAQAALTLDGVRKTVADEWGSHLCYRDSFGRRSCKKDNISGRDNRSLGCRCEDIAKAIVSQHGSAALSSAQCGDRS